MRANRIIKFRAWGGHKMIDDFLQVTENGRFIAHVSEGEDFTPLQFTGLLDKNGKEIYEGDILDGFRKGSNSDRRYKGAIEWNTQQAGWIIRCDKYIMEIVSLAQHGFDDGSVYLSSFEVVGNIYETNLLTPQTR